jgi:hypothetical protein
MGANIIMNSNQVEIGHLLGVPRKVPWKQSFSYVAMAKHYNGHLENCG